jgi:hypothetical protein
LKIKEEPIDEGKLVETVETATDREEFQQIKKILLRFAAIVADDLNNVRKRRMFRALVRKVILYSFVVLVLGVLTDVIVEDVEDVFVFGVKLVEEERKRLLRAAIVVGFVIAGEILRTRYIEQFLSKMKLKHLKRDMPRFMRPFSTRGPCLLWPPCDIRRRPEGLIQICLMRGHSH